jgi:pimeloyl-ACP methyl ester carboxylesterase
LEVVVVTGLEPRTDLVVHRYGRSDPDAPVMVFLNGLTDSGEGWPGAARHWGERYAVVSFDQRGHGRSPRFTRQELDAHLGEAMVQDATAILEQLPRPVLVGHSMGGAVALTVAVRRPELVSALVLEDPAPLGPDAPQRDRQWGKAFLDDLRGSFEAEDQEALYLHRKRQHPHWPDDELLVTGRAEQRMDLDYLENGDFMPVTRWPELFARVSVPTLVVTGDRSEEVCVDGSMEQALDRLANPVLTVARVPEAGHCVRRDQPERFFAVVDGWLDRPGPGDDPTKRVASIRREASA